MKILFDHQTFTEQTFGGISRYFSELIVGINNTADNQAILSLLFSNNIHLHENGLDINRFFPNINNRIKMRFMFQANRLFSIAKLNQTSYDIFHTTYYDPYFVPYLKGRPFVVTFLDMIHEKLASEFPELANDRLISKHKQLLADRADRIITISESTKRDVIELLKVDPAKIEVIYLGNSLKPIISDMDQKFDSEPYLLFVGRRERYKNFEGLLRAIYPLLKKYKLKLVCAGGGPFVNDERTLIHSVGADDWVVQQPINDDKTLQKLYQQAVAFIFPSLYEGFGIPVLEAFACSCPCVVSNTSSLPEVAGEAVLYMDPADPESIRIAIDNIILDSELRKKLVERGRQQLLKFSWKRTVDETLSLYHMLS